MTKPRWHKGQTLTAVDVRDIGRIYIEKSSLERCCRDHLDQIEQLKEQLAEALRGNWEVEASQAITIEMLKNENAKLRAALLVQS